MLHLFINKLELFFEEAGLVFDSFHFSQVVHLKLHHHIFRNLLFVFHEVIDSLRSSFYRFLLFWTLDPGQHSLWFRFPQTSLRFSLVEHFLGGLEKIGNRALRIDIILHPICWCVNAKLTIKFILSSKLQIVADGPIFHHFVILRKQI